MNKSRSVFPYIVRYKIKVPREYAESLSSVTILYGNRLMRRLGQSIYECARIGNQNNREHVLESAVGCQVCFLHIESGGFHGPECSFNLPSEPVYLNM